MLQRMPLKGSCTLPLLFLIRLFSCFEERILRDHQGGMEVSRGERRVEWDIVLTATAQSPSHSQRCT